MRILTAPFLGVLGQTLPATVQFKVMYLVGGTTVHSVGAALIAVPQKFSALPSTEIKQQQTDLNLM